MSEPPGLLRRVDGMDRFPDQNPHPVLRMGADGRLLYANAAAAPVCAAWRTNVGEQLPAGVVEELRAAAATNPPRRVELTHDGRTFDVLAVHLADIDAFNLYGTDITAAKLVRRFPDRNPNPVLRMTPTGTLLYANDASRPIIEALTIDVGDPLPEELYQAFRAALAHPGVRPPEVAGAGGRTYLVTPVEIPEFEFVNLYGTDITAQKAIDKFPNQNPNPVLRLSWAGRLTYANPASMLVRKALGAEVGDELDPAAFARVVAALEDSADPTMEVETDGTVYRLRVVSVYEFASINLYGTDITAVRQVEAYSAENERLLLNVLPPSIAARLRAGESEIADRFDDMAVLFADVVGFTELSSRLTPPEVLGLLNGVFRICDELADRFGLEKIKTIGDAYLVVGGLRDDVEPPLPPGRSHTADVADMGLAMLDALARMEPRDGVHVQVRVGMHVGPVVAGVIGLRKFIYDVWGDTVNTASRMESTGVPGRIQVTRATYERLVGEFVLEPRGVIDVKGKGPTETWFVVGRR